MRAEVNHGRWIVACAASDCYAALRVTGTEAECDCKDEQICDHPQIPCGERFKVDLPDKADEIEQVLNLRPQRRNRNWTSETLAELKSENVTHGVRV